MGPCPLLALAVFRLQELSHSERILIAGGICAVTGLDLWAQWMDRWGQGARDLADGRTAEDERAVGESGDSEKRRGLGLAWLRWGPREQ